MEQNGKVLALNFPVAELQQAMVHIMKGMCSKVEVNDHVKVYKVGNIIRIDIKPEEV